MKRVYVAGAMGATRWEHPVLGYLKNVGRGIRGTVEVLLAGFSPFCPFVDFNYWLHLFPGEDITEEQIKECSMAWVDVCDVLFVLPGSEHSMGTKAEISRAMGKGIPVYTSLKKMVENEKGH